MTRPLRMRLCLPITAAIAAALALPTAAAAADVVPGEVLVRYVAGTSPAERADVRDDAGTRSIRSLGLSRSQLLKVTDGDSVAATVRQLEAESDVAYAAPNQILRPALLPNDPEFSQQWGLFNDGQLVPAITGSAGTIGADIDAPSAWNIETGDPATVVAVMDTGADLAHPDLVNQLWTNTIEAGGTPGLDDDGNGYIDDVNGYDFYDSDPVPGDLTGHGTHVSGIALAEGNNADDTAGVSWEASLMSLRICSSSYINGCPVADEIDAMEYAGEMGADVLNGSIEGGGPANPFVLAAAQDHPDTLFVFAAGNGGGDGVGDNNDASPRYPCAIDQDPAYTEDNVICVAATNHFDGRASFSNYGASSVDLGAPGAEILSTSAEKQFFADNFETANFDDVWTNDPTNTPIGADWERTNEAPLTSFGVTDSPGSDYSPNTDSTVTSDPVTLPADLYSSCELHYDRATALGSGDQFTIEVLLDGVREEWRNFTSASNSGLTPRFFPLNPTFDAGGQVQVRLVLDIDATGGAQGIHMDNIELFCYGSPSDQGTEYLSGTSMATPMVSGAAALLFSNLPPATAPAEVKARLLNSVDPVSALSGITTSGGRLNVYRALIGDFNAPGGEGDSGSEGGGSSVVSPPRKPNTFFNRKPGFVVRTPDPVARVVFRFGSTEAGSTFRCQLDSLVFQPCPKKFVRLLPPARHLLKVKAVSADGAVDPTAAVSKFRVKRIEG